MAWYEYNEAALSDDLVRRLSGGLPEHTFRKNIDPKNYEGYLTPGEDGMLSPQAFRGNKNVAVIRLIEAMRRGLGDAEINWIGGNQTVEEYYHELIRDPNVNGVAIRYSDAMRKYHDGNAQKQPQSTTAQQPQSEAQNAKGDNAPSVKTQAEQVGARGFKTEEERSQEREDAKGRLAESMYRRAQLDARTALKRKETERTRLETEQMRANARANTEARYAKKGLSAQDIQSRMANIRRAYGKDISDDQWRSATGFDPNADIGAMGRADRQRLAQSLDNLAGRVDRYNQGQARQKRIQDARAYQRQIMEDRGYWSKGGGFRSNNGPVFAPNGMTAAQVDFSNRLKAQRMAREMSPTTRGQRAAYGQMLNDGTVTSMNIASFQGMGMQGDRLNQAIGATTGGQAYLNMRDAIEFQRNMMMHEAKMRGQRSAAAMGALGANALTGGSPNDPATQAAVDNVANGTPPPTPVQTQQAAAQTAQAQRGFNIPGDVPPGVNENEYYAAKGYREMGNPMRDIEQAVANDPRNKVPVKTITPGTDQSGEYDEKEVKVYANGL